MDGLLGGGGGDDDDSNALLFGCFSSTCAHSLPQSSTRSLVTLRSFTHTVSLAYSFTQRIVDSLTITFTHLPTLSLAHSLTLRRSFFTLTSTYSHRSPQHPSISHRQPSPTHTLTHSPSQPTTQPSPAFTHTQTTRRISPITPRQSIHSHSVAVRDAVALFRKPPGSRSANQATKNNITHP